MANSSSQQGQLQRSGIQRLISDKRGRMKEHGVLGMKWTHHVSKLTTHEIEQQMDELDRRARDQGGLGRAAQDRRDDLEREWGKRQPKKESRIRASRIRESYGDSFTEKGQEQTSKSPEGKKQKNRVYLVTIIEEGLGNSKDKNYYSAEALQSGVNVFNGAKAYADHPDAITEKTLPERSMKDLVGWYSDCYVDKNPQTGKTRLRGKLHFFPTAIWLTNMIDTILTDPSAKNLFGISINAVGKTRQAMMGGEEVNYVEQFQRVDSADVVTEPAARGKFDQMLESRRSVTGGHSRKVSVSMKATTRRTREAAGLSSEKTKEVADSLVSAYNSDNPDEVKQAAFEAARVLHASAGISGKGPGQANEEQYSNINPSPSSNNVGGKESMAKRRVKASVGKRSFRKGKRLQAAAGTGPDNDDEGEPSESDIEGRLEEADVEDEEGRGDLGMQSQFGGGSKYRKVKAARAVVPIEEDEDEGFEDEGLEGMEDEGMEDEDEDSTQFSSTPAAGKPPAGADAGGGMPGAPPPMGGGGGVPGSSRAVASEAYDDDDDDGDDGDDDLDDMDEADEAFEDEGDMTRPGVIAEAGRRRGSFRRRAHEADGGQGQTKSNASFAGGLGHSGHTSLPKGADPDRGYEDSDEDYGKKDDSTSGVGKSYKLKTSRFARNRRQRQVAKPIVREANRRIEYLTDEVVRLRESNRAKDIKINRFRGKMRMIESQKSADKILREAVSKDILPRGVAVTIYPNLLGMSRDEQIREVKKTARFLEATQEGTVSRLTESVDGSGARGGFVFRESAGQNSELVEGLANLGVPMKDEDEE
jgi:hypothetical protein